jgi:hypothetical protein
VNNVVKCGELAFNGYTALAQHVQPSILEQPRSMAVFLARLDAPVTMMEKLGYLWRKYAELRSQPGVDGVVARQLGSGDLFGQGN